MIVSWMTTNQCNLTCKHCYQDAGNQKEAELTTEEGKKLIDEIARAGFKIMIFSFLALLIGGLFAYFMFDTGVSHSVSISSNYNAKAFQIGVFSREENAIRVAALNQGIVVPDGNLYRVYIAILNDKDAISYLEQYYGSVGINYYIRDINVSSEFLDNIRESEEKIKSCDNKNCSNIALSILNKYEESL